MLASAAILSSAFVLTPRSSFALSNVRKLKFYHTHTGEKLAIDYFDGKQYIPDALDEINQYLKDFRTGEAHTMDARLLDVLYQLQVKVDKPGTFEIISGYRSPKTNAKLRNKSKGVARNSLHMQGKAVDIRLAGFDTGKLNKAARSLSSGGVGYYPKSNFIHVDTGRVRTW